MYFSVIWYLFFTTKNEEVFILFNWNISSFFYHFISLHRTTRGPSQINSTVSMSGLHAVSSSDDVKPPFGLRPLSAHSPGPMVSQKRLCAICGDRSSGTSLINTYPNPSGGNTEQGYRVRPNFSVVRQKTCATSCLRKKEKKSPRLWKSPCGSITDTH